MPKINRMNYRAIILFLLSTPAFALGIRGRVEVEESCRAGKTMVWLSKNEAEFAKKELLLHTAVPERGTFEFYVLPGDYLVTASNERGCSAERQVRINEKDVVLELELKEKKK